MTGWLLYDEWNIARNRAFIERWLDAGRRRGVLLDLVTTGELCFGVSGDSLSLLRGGASERPDFAVMRAQRPLLTRHLERMGVPVFNGSRVAEICNDKRATHLLLAGRVPMMDTAFLEQDAFHSPFPFPVVVKAAHGCGGRGVHLAGDEAQLRSAMEAVAPDAAVVQPLCDLTGRDLRLYLLGERVVQAMLRYSNDDFRSNLGLGGGFEPCEPDATALRYAAIISSLFRFGLVGVDFIFHRGTLVFNEIEDVVGSRMLYMKTGIDIAADYLDFILSAVAQGVCPPPGIPSAPGPAGLPPCGKGL